MSLAKFNGNNIGGIVAMWVMPLTSYNGTSYNVLTGMHKLINSFNEFGSIYFTDSTCEVEVTEKRCNELEFELKAKIPKVRPDAMTLFNYLRIPFVLLMQDANDQFQIVGSEVDPLVMEIKQEKGGEVSDFNHTLLSIKRDLMMKPLWVEDPRPKGIVPVPDPDPVVPLNEIFFSDRIYYTGEEGNDLVDIGFISSGSYINGIHEMTFLNKNTNGNLFIFALTMPSQSLRNVSAKIRIQFDIWFDNPLKSNLFHQFFFEFRFSNMYQIFPFNNILYASADWRSIVVDFDLSPFDSNLLMVNFRLNTFNSTTIHTIEGAVLKVKNLHFYILD